MSYEITEEDLREAFESFGKVKLATIIKDKFNRAPKGFGFVEMPDKDEAQAAINALNAKELNGRTIIVNEAIPQRQRRGD